MRPLLPAATLLLAGLALAQEAPTEEPAKEQAPAGQQAPAPPPPPASQPPPPAPQPPPPADQPPAAPQSQSAPAPQAPLVTRHTVPFRLDEALTINSLVGSLRVPDLTIKRDEAKGLAQLMSPAGGMTRFSYLLYSFAAENPGQRSATLRARVQLLDKNNAVIDEFELDRRIGAGKAQPLEIRRITLNYALQYVDTLTVTFSAE